jgi:hypothetical protein
MASDADAEAVPGAHSPGERPTTSLEERHTSASGMTPEQALPGTRLEDWQNALLWLIAVHKPELDLALSEPQRRTKFLSELTEWQSNWRADPARGPRRLFEIYQAAGVIDQLLSAGVLPLSGAWIFQTQVGKGGWRAGSARPLRLDGVPAGLRAEVRWPRAGGAQQVRLALIIDDRRALGLDHKSPVELAVATFSPTPRGLPWADWLDPEAPRSDVGLPPGVLVNTFRCVVRPTTRSCLVPLTRASAALSDEQTVHLRGWIAEGHLHVLVAAANSIAQQQRSALPSPG